MEHHHVQADAVEADAEGERGDQERDPDDDPAGEHEQSLPAAGPAGWPLSDAVVRGAWRTGPRRRTLDPMLDREICDRARTARDARFDGRFVSGVLTTRIYCRPVCPVRPARSANVIFFPTAAAAETGRLRVGRRVYDECAGDSHEGFQVNRACT